jgi:hypothetical protein
MSAKDVGCTPLIVEYNCEEMVPMMDDKPHRHHATCIMLRDEVVHLDFFHLCIT